MAAWDLACNGYSADSSPFGNGSKLCEDQLEELKKPLGSLAAFQNGSGGPRNRIVKMALTPLSVLKGS